MGDVIWRVGMTLTIGISAVGVIIAIGDGLAPGSPGTWGFWLGIAASVILLPAAFLAIMYTIATIRDRVGRRRVRERRATDGTSGDDDAPAGSHSSPVWPSSDVHGYGGDSCGDGCGSD